MTPLLLMLPGMVVDIVLNPIFILGSRPAPALGIMGAGVATLIANLVSFTLVLVVIYKRDLPVRLRGEEFHYLWPDRELVFAIISKGVPMGLQMIVMAVSAIAMLGLVNQQGTDTVRSLWCDDAIVDLCSDAGARHRHGGQHDGRAKHRRRTVGQS